LNHHPYLERLAAIGVTPEQVDFVMCTHLHVDHVGWNTRLVEGRWSPTFPNAKYLFSAIEWQFWQQHYRQADFTDDPYYEDSILPVIAAGQAVYVESHYEIDTGVCSN
jgi:glyoxylase-like metal-dependent hydrolase (beta-lactamase superfamily II)